MMIAGVCIGRSIHTWIRASSSAILLVTLLVSYTADRDCTREISGMVGISIYVVDECELLMAVMATVAVPWDIVGC